MIKLNRIKLKKIKQNEMIISNKRSYTLPHQGSMNNWQKWNKINEMKNRRKKRRWMKQHNKSGIKIRWKKIRKSKKKIDWFDNMKAIISNQKRYFLPQQGLTNDKNERKYRNIPKIPFHGFAGRCRKSL